MSSPAVPASSRNVSIDLLRGVVMALMALDHVRDFFGARAYSPEDLSRTTLPLFLTRWITHYCAPVFVFLAGTAVYLSAAKGKPRPEMRRFLVTRGLWLVLLEITVVRLGWFFDVQYRFTMLQVIWVIGWSMVTLAAVLALPVRAIGALGAALVVAHHLLDDVHPLRGTAWEPLWWMLHEATFQGWQPWPRVHVSVAYPLVPWAGVMMLGYAMGAWILRPAKERQRLVGLTGVALTVGFVILRATNLYGDPRPWSVQPRGLAMTVASFLNCNKYPPSLCYVLMTLGPALMALAAFDRLRLGERAGTLASALVVFGRVPLFYYVLHLFAIHLPASFVAWRMIGVPPWHWMAFGRPIDLGLPATYAIWVAVVTLLYFPCRWYARIKGEAMGRRRIVLSYL